MVLNYGAAELDSGDGDSLRMPPPPGGRSASSTRPALIVELEQLWMSPTAVPRACCLFVLLVLYNSDIQKFLPGWPRGTKRANDDSTGNQDLFSFLVVV